MEDAGVPGSCLVLARFFLLDRSIHNTPHTTTSHILLVCVVVSTTSTIKLVSCPTLLVSYLIASGRYSSGPRRTHKIDSCRLFLAKRQRESFGQNLSKLWETMLAMEEESRRALRDVIGKTVLRRIDKSRQEHPEREVTIDYLDEKSADLVRF
jgi:hypothetical protein